MACERLWGASASLILGAEEVSLGPEAAAFVPALAPARLNYPVRVGTNTAATVRTFNGWWDSPVGMVCVVNFTEETVILSRGDRVGIAKAAKGELPSPVGGWRTLGKAPPKK